MRIEEQICSVEQANKLKEFGIIQSSCFYYVNNWRNPRGEPIADGQHVIMSCEKHMTSRKGTLLGTGVEFVSAYTAMELGKLLPSILPSPDLEYGMVLRQLFPDGKEQEDYVTDYVEVFSDLDYGASIYECSGRTEAISRANLLIELLEKGIICSYDTVKNNHYLEL